MHRLTRTDHLAAAALLAACLLAGQPTRAQLTAPNASGVAMGHLHYLVADPAAEAGFWERLGGVRSAGGVGELVRFPNVILIIGEGNPAGGTEGSVLNHVAFRVASLAAIEAQGFELHLNEQFPGIASIYSPSGERIELFDDVEATNTWFNPDEGDLLAANSAAEGGSSPLRHNAPVSAPIVTHHVHFYLPEAEVVPARDWYVEHFGAVPGKRWRYDAADLPGMNLNFSATSATLAPTAGRALDHIGFEITGLAAFVARLEAAGVTFERGYTRLPSGFAMAFFVDPWGTRIELTEGLAGM